MSLSDKYRKELRKKAEAFLSKQDNKDRQKLSTDLESLVEELNKYQIELEEQNRVLQLLQQASEEQKNKYVDLFENAPNGYLIINEQQQIISSNKKATELLNIPASRLNNQKLSLFLAPEYQDEFYFMIKSVLKQTKELSRQLDIINVNKERKPVYCIAEAFGDEKQLIRIALVDITTQKHPEEDNYFKAAILENVTDCIFTINKAGLITFWNTGAKKLFGFSEKEALGKEIHQLITNSKKSTSAKNAIIKMAKTGISEIPNKTLEFEAKKKDGSLFSAELKLSSVKMNGEIHAIGIVRDITKHKKEELRLQENETRYQTIFDNVKEALYIQTTDGKFLDCNTALLELTQYSYEEVQQIHPSEILDPSVSKNYFPNLNKLLKNKSLILNTIISGKHGNKIPVEINANIIHYKGQEAILISARDITERIRERKKLEDSERRFRTMADNIPDAIYIHNIEGKILDTNEKATEMLGYSRKELLGLTPLDISAKYHIAEDYKNIIRKIEKEKLVIFEDEHLTKNKNKIPVQLSSSVITYKNKPAVFSVAHDITNRKIAQKAQNKLLNQLNYLSRSATRFISFSNYEDIYRFLGKSLHLAIENSIIIVKKYENKKFRIIDFIGLHPDLKDSIHYPTSSKKEKASLKPTPERIKKYKSGKLEKAGTIKELLPNNYSQELIEELNNKQNIAETRVIGVTRDDVLYAGINILTEQPIDITDQEYIEALVYQASIALQRKNHENELIKAKNNAEIANNAKSTFLTNISHEIRTPLNTILGFTEILRNEIKDEKQRNYLQSINSSGKSLLTIINDVLDLSKIESDNMLIKHEPMSVKTLINDMEYLLQELANEKNLNFEINTDKSVPRLVKLDQPRLRQILQNLVSNAIKFTHKGEVKLEVNTAHKKANKTDLIFKVIDTGIGISLDKINEVIEPFHQADNTDARKFEGVGMGLSIAQKLTNLLNGELTIESEINKGSTFTVQLKDVPILEADNFKSQRINSELKFNKERILLVEEDNVQGEIIQTMLEKINLLVLKAETGDQAFAFTFEFNPQLIIIDLSTQTSKSTGTAKAIKSLDQFSSLPIIGISRFDIQEFKNMDIAAYFSDIIKPPLTKSAVLKKIMKYIPFKKPLSDNDNIGESTYNFNEYDKTALQNTLSKLNEKATPIWNLLEKRQPLSKVKNFNDEVYQIAKNNKITILITYSQQLNESLEAFDIIQMRKLLKEYPIIIEALQNQINQLKA